MITVAKKTGDYSVLSQADLSVLALTYGLAEDAKEKENSQAPTENELPALEISNGVESVEETEAAINDLVQQLEEVTVTQKEANGKHEPESIPDEVLAEESSDDQLSEGQPVFDDPSSEDDGEGEWITPTNVAMHKSRALSLLPDTDSNRGQNESTTLPIQTEKIEVGCMTADFAMQNVLLHMGLILVDVEGKRISHVKTWVLRCHACFKYVYLASMCPMISQSPQNLQRF